MSRIIYTKNDGETIKGNRVTLTYKSPFLRKGEKVTFIDNDVVKKSNEKTISAARKLVNNMVNELYFYDKKIIVSLFNSINNVKTEKDMTKISEKICSIYRTNIEPTKPEKTVKKYQLNKPVIKEHVVDSREFSNLLSENPELINSLVVKKVLTFYFTKKISSKGCEEINKIEAIKNADIGMDKIIDVLGIKFSEQSKINGVYELSKKILNDTIDNVFDETQKHLCWDCQSAFAGQCPKVSDWRKKVISQYDDIIDGYQVVGQNNQLQTFVVTKCKKFKRDKKK